MFKKLLIAFLLVNVNLIFAQGKANITLEDIWKNYKYMPAGFGGFNSMNDGITYSNFDEAGNLVKYDVKTDKKISTLVKKADVTVDGKEVPFEDYSFSEDETKMLIPTETEGIYRHSATVVNYVYDFKTKKTQLLSAGGKQMFATFSPIGNSVAFVRDNNIFIKDLNSNTETQITKDGELNKIKNGWADWVYEEEFSKAEAFFWNSNATKIAYIKFDETNVKEFDMPIYTGLYPETYRFKYPKAGEANSIVSVHIYDVATGTTVKVDIGKEKDIYIPRIVWTKDANILSVQRLNRLQNKLELLFADAKDGSTKTILTEEAKTYIDVADDLTFLAGNKGFIWTSEKDGYNHIYHYDFTGKLVNQLTKGNWDVMAFKGYDEKAKMLYYISTEVSATDRDLYSVSLDGKKKKKMSIDKGTTDAEFMRGFKYYVSSYSNANTPPVIDLRSADGKLVKVLEDNKTLRDKMKGLNLTKKEFFTMKNTDGVELNGWMMKPTDFDATKKYPVFMFAYGGPGSNECNNQWETFDYLWHQLLCENGYVVVCVDGRGTLGRGREFKHSTYMQLGKLETLDQIDVAKYMGEQAYVDKNRIGFMGWSFGGYLSSLLITKGADYFKANIAVAPVTNWRYYDNIYTERFLRTPQENPSGYDDNSPINFVKQIKGKFLLVHGTADDNVHFQNSMEMSNALVKNNIPFDMMMYPNKNHGIYGGMTRYHLYNKMYKFILENL